MGNCLVTKLKESVQNDSLLKLGEVKFTVNCFDSRSAIEFYVNHETTFNFSRPVTVNNNDNVSTYNAAAGTINIKTPLNAATVISIENKYNVAKIEVHQDGGAEYQDLDINGIEYMPLSVFRDFSVRTLTGVDSIDFVKNTEIGLSTVQYRNVFEIRGNRNLAGDIGVFSNRVLMKSIAIQGKSSVDDAKNDVTGNIEDLVRLVELTNLDIRKTQVVGNADVFLAALAASGRTTNLSLRINPSLINMTGKTTSTDYTIRFNGGMVNPTQEETARGWQIA